MAATAPRPTMRRRMASRRRRKGTCVLTTTATGSCALIRPGETYQGKQGFDYFAGVSAQRVGAKAICMHLLEIPPGGRAKAHLHEDHETAIYIIAGRSVMWHGQNLAERMDAGAGDFV